MKLLQFIKEITDSEEEFLAVIEEMNKWVGTPFGRRDEEIEKRNFYVPNNISRFGFNRDTHRKALETASQAIQYRKTNTRKKYLRT